MMVGPERSSRGERLGRELQAAHELTAELSRASSLAQVARAIFEKGLAAFGADAGAIALVDEDRPDFVELFDQSGYDDTLIDEWRRFPLSLVSPVTDAIRSGEPVWVESPTEALQRFPEWAPALKDAPDRAWAALPVALGSRVIGAIGLTFYAERQFDDDERAWLGSVAARCADALERAHATERLQDALNRLRLAQEAAGLTIHDFDPTTGNVRWDGRVRELWGLGPAEPATYERFLARLHPADRAQTEMAVERALDPKGNGRYYAEYRVIHAVTGAARWVAATGHVSFRSGRAVRLVGTAQDITERKRIEEARSTYEAELHAARTKAERAATLAETFMAVLGHDLRNPLSAIQTGAALLLKSSTDERQRRIAERLLRSGERMARMIEQILDFTRIRVGKGLPYEPAPTDLGDVLSRACEDFSGADRAISIQVDGDARGTWDDDRLMQVFSNLLANAIQHSPTGAVVTVRIDGSRVEEVEVVVRNPGTIPPDVVPEIFEPFRQGRDSSSRGLGLGLFITKEIIIAHGGTIAVSSSEAAGTQFRFALPRSPHGETASE
jgi:PAS domain S-box-containing protein